ncbi:MAG: hypothetical protein HYU86_00960 [Chloroflexi bacterium]|nr:hypothetical protein [Chloroflexota bacterium]
MRRLDAVCSFCSSGVSVVCMSSVGAALAAAGTAEAASMAGMGSIGASSSGVSAFFIIPRFFDRLGLDVLNQVPNAVAQPLLVTLLTISVVASYLAYRGHRRPHILALTLATSTAMYVSIYVWMSEPLYFVSLVGLLAASAWSFFLAKRPSQWSQSRAQTPVM